MPQLVKGVKHVYGWSIVSDVGDIKIPGEALTEYGYKSGDRLILIPGSKRSKGFSISTLKKLRSTSFIDQLSLSTTPLYGVSEGEIINIKGKPFSWVKLDDKGRIRLPLMTL